MARVPPFNAVPVRAEELKSPRLPRLLAYWSQIKGADALPPRGRLDPAEIGYILAQVIWLEVLQQPLDFLFRIIGMGTQAISQADKEGKTIGVIQPQAYQDMVRRDYEDVVSRRAPVYHRIEVGFPVGETKDVPSYERIILPFAGDGESDGDRVAFLLVGSDWPTTRTHELALALAKSRGELS